MSMVKWYWGMTTAQRFLIWILGLPLTFLFGGLLAVAMQTDRNDPVPFCMLLSTTIIYGTLLYAHLGKSKYIQK